MDKTSKIKIWNKTILILLLETQCLKYSTQTNKDTILNEKV